MALRQDPIRLLIADDVGVGKTIEAAMVARELLDRGAARRLGVICAPHLCDQWEAELREKFNIHAAVVQPSRMARLERELPRADTGVFQYHRHLVASIDFIKSQRYRAAFIDNAPDLIIVDEAHTAARPRGDRTSRQHQRYDFLNDLMKSGDRHLILATATPHSGVEESFRSLLGLLDPAFDLPVDVDLPNANLVPHVVQRRRRDLQNWLGADTPFPERESEELSYLMSAPYLKLFEDVLAYCRESISTGGGQQQRVRYWAATAILRCVLSSPAAAEAMLEKRAKSKAETATSTEQNEIDQEMGGQILDDADEDEPPDYVPTAPLDDPAANLTDEEIRRLDGFLKSARALGGTDHDTKLLEVTRLVDALLQEGFSPIVYCRFIATAKYVAEHLQSRLARRHEGLRVTPVTGGDGDAEQRKEIVDNLGAEPTRVLVATDCLSEGINLQEHFDAVVHYDLPWNPNRLEQREGRVDRFGQHRPKVKAALLYGQDNPVDAVVLDVLIRKARTIRSRLGIAVPVPVDSEQVVQAIVDSVLLRRVERAKQLALPITDEKVSTFHDQWDKAAEREDRARTFFAQQGIKPDEVTRELEEIDPALGSASDVHEFVSNAIQRFSGELRTTKGRGVFELHPGDLVAQMVSRDPKLAFPLKVAFDGVPPDGVSLLGRNHPVVAAVTSATLARALSGEDDKFARCGAIYTDQVQLRTAVLVLRLRYLLEEGDAQQFAEEVVVSAFRRKGEALELLTPFEEALRLLREAKPVVANISSIERQQQVNWSLASLSGEWYRPVVAERVAALEQSHARLRSLVKSRPLKVQAHEPPDMLGCYVLVPAGRQ